MMVSRDLFLRLSKKNREKTDKSSTVYSVLSTQPPIIYAPQHSPSLMPEIKPIFEYLKNQTAYFLISWCWDMEDIVKVESLSYFERQHIDQYPKHQFIHLCNTMRQQEMFINYRLNAVFCHQNCLLDARIFNPIDLPSKQFDAVYDAQIAPYKRHYLASKIKNIAFIYYYDPIRNGKYYEEVVQQFPNACFINSYPSGTHRNLSPIEVNEYLNQCKVGLCLSSIEGAMWASTQYLLSGLPVVSTRSKGGREVFFDDAYALVVDDDPDAVKEAVDELIRRNIKPDTIRDSVLKKIEQHRMRLMSIVQKIYDQEDVDRDFSAEWSSIFFHKLIKYQKPELAIEQFEQAKLV